MTPPPPSSTSIQFPARASRFDQTSHTLLENVRNGDGDALEQLCQRYWYPLYTWLLASRMARSDQDAQDIVQGFFAKMLARGTLAAHRPERGRFRTYLLTCLKNHVIDLVRKPTVPTVEMTETQVESFDPAEHGETADEAYEKAWAWELFGSAKDSIRRAWEGDGQGELFDAFAPYLEGNRSDEGLEAIGARFGLSHDNTRVRLHRLKKQLREVLTRLVTKDLPDDATPEERSAEMRHFLQALLL